MEAHLQKRRAAWAGLLVNAPLAAGKIVAPLAAQSQALVADGVHIALDPAMTLSEGHRLCEAARAEVLAQVPEVAEIIIHPEPDGHADGRAAYDAALRPELKRVVQDCLDGIVPPQAIRHPRLDYRDQGMIALVEPRQMPIEGAQRRVELRLGACDSDLAEIRLLWAPV